MTTRTKMPVLQCVETSAESQRALDTASRALDFLTTTLGFVDNPDLQGLAQELARLERHNAGLRKEDTLISTKHQHPRHNDLDKRSRLWVAIINDLYSTSRIADPPGIQPKTALTSDRKMFFIIGPPASGKSSIADAISDCFGAAILDPDFAKPRFPEYDNGKNAHLIHRESSCLINGGLPWPDPTRSNAGNRSVLERCLVAGHNMILPWVGRTHEDLVELAQHARSINYLPYLICVTTPPVIAARRAFRRWIESDRYVPLSYIIDEVAYLPLLNYYRLRTRYAHLWQARAVLDTSADWPPKCVCSSGWTDAEIASLKAIDLHIEPTDN